MMLYIFANSSFSPCRQHTRIFLSFLIRNVLIVNDPFEIVLLQPPFLLLYLYIYLKEITISISPHFCGHNKFSKIFVDCG